jgi:ribosomal protein S18 acetylase RimI-like enzyme
MDRDEVTIRPYQPRDLDDLYRICLLTADGGQDATPVHADPQLPGHLHAAPYGLFEPDLAFVAQDSAGVGGYLVAALDTQAFEERLESDWWPRLRSRYPDPPPDLRREGLTPDQFAARVVHHPWIAAPEISQRYPSHLHINLLPRLQGRGQGRALISALITALRAHGSPGLHLHVSLSNEPAPGFYRRVGFTEIPAADVRVFVMDLSGTP